MSRALALPRPSNVIVWLTAIVLLAVVLRLPTLNMGLWFDELVSIHEVQVPDFGTLISTQYGSAYDLHPPLFFILLFPIVHFLGTNEIIVRMPSLLCGLLLIPAMYWLGKTVHSPSVGLLAAFFAAISPFANYLSCQTRDYSLAMVLTAVSLVLFCRLIKSADDKRSFISFVVVTTMLCYSEYISGILLPSLGVATVLISLRQWQNDATKTEAIPTFKRGILALVLVFLLFVPWIPSMLQQAHYSALYHNPTPLYMWPIVFSFDLVMMLPIPLPISIPLSILLLLPLSAYVLLNWKRLRTDIPRALVSLPDSYVVLMCATLLPASIVGYVGYFYIGYYRHICPFSAGGWTLLAIITARLIGLAKDNENSKPRLAALLAVLLGVFVVNVWHLWWFDSRPQSGLITVAHEALKGKYDNTAILLVPDHIGYTLDHYLPESDRAPHHIVLYGYARPDVTQTLGLSDLPKAWGADCVTRTEKLLDELPKTEYKYLAVMMDNPHLIEDLSSTAVPKAQRVKALMEIIGHKYKKLSVRKYAGVTENVTVETYQFSDPPPR